MKAIVRNIILALIGISMTTSCAMWNNETNGAILGGIGGTLVGGAVGELLGGRYGGHIGSHVGSTIGAVAGAAAGREKDRREREHVYSSHSNGDYYDEQSGLTYVRLNRDGDLVFRSNSTSLEVGSDANLNRIYKQVSRNSYDIYIYGSTDSRERNAHTLSQKRADVVARYLINRGISARRIHTVALGSGSPLGDNSTSRGRSLNRSVEVFIVK